jgi:hypothetical protein
MIRMQKSLPKGRPKENAQNSFGVGANKLVWFNENDFNGKGLNLHDFY